jgi:uncharacterized membrane protein YphA (DoxX/SURF4 family)
LKKWLRDADQALFGYGSPLPMGIFRIFVGFLSAISLSFNFRIFTDMFTEKGLYPVWMSERYTEGIPRFDLLAGVTDSRVTMVFLVIAVLAAVLTMVGLFTRVASVVLFLLMVTLHHRSGDTLMAADWLLRMWVFSVAVGPSGATLSLDRRFFGKGAPVEEVSLWPQRLVQFQLAVVYFMTVWLKWSGDLWREGLATYYAGLLREFDRFPVPGVMHSIPIVKISTYGTLLIELAMATLVFSKPMRKWVMIPALMMHAYIEYSMNIPLFQWIIVSAFVCHFGGDEILSWWGKVRDRFGKKTPVLEAEVA